MGASCLGTVSSGGTPEVNSGHASDYCLIFLSSNQFVLFLDVLLRQCSMEKGLVFFFDVSQERSAFLSD